MNRVSSIDPSELLERGEKAIDSALLHDLEATTRPHHPISSSVREPRIHLVRPYQDEPRLKFYIRDPDTGRSKRCLESIVFPPWIECWQDLVAGVEAAAQASATPPEVCRLRIAA